MRIFWTQRKLDEYINERLGLTYEVREQIARKAAADALHYYSCFRTFEWWHKALDEAEKSGKDKYMSLAQLFTKVQNENESKR